MTCAVGVRRRAGELFAKKAKLPGGWRINRSGQREVLGWLAVRAIFSWRKNRSLMAAFGFVARIVVLPAAGAPADWRRDEPPDT
jgi:hypothetical protein